MKMGRRPRCSSVTYRFRYAPLLAPCRRPILIATKAMLVTGQDTGSIFEAALVEDRKSLAYFFTSFYGQTERHLYLLRGVGPLHMDHVPPENLFERGQKSNLVTVPCCHRCNNTASKED